jgi:hypothetical protein
MVRNINAADTTIICAARATAATPPSSRVYFCSIRLVTRNILLSSILC